MIAGLGDRLNEFLAPIYWKHIPGFRIETINTEGD